MAVQLAIWEIANERTQTIADYNVAYGLRRFLRGHGLQREYR